MPVGWILSASGGDSKYQWGDSKCQWGDSKCHWEGFLVPVGGF